MEVEFYNKKIKLAYNVSSLSAINLAFVAVFLVIIGSLIQVGMAVLIATPIGVLAGIFLAELGDRSLLGRVVRFINDVLLSAPSILIGLFVYQILVRPFGGFSGIAGAIALGIIILPVNTLMQRVCPHEFLHGHALVMKKGQLLSRDKLRAQLEQAGYRSVDQVM